MVERSRLVSIMSVRFKLPIFMSDRAHNGNWRQTFAQRYVSVSNFGFSTNQRRLCLDSAFFFVRLSNSWHRQAKLVRCAGFSERLPTLVATDVLFSLAP